MLVAAAAVIAFILWVAGVGITIIVMVMVLLLAATAAALTWDYLTRRRFYKELAAALENNRERYFITELVKQPTFAEGQLLYETLELAAKDMNDRIASYRLASEEYQEYVETWIHEVKTPLAAAHLIIDNKNDVGLHSLKHEIERTEAYIEQALYYARSTAVEKDYLLKTVNLETLVKSTAKKHARSLIEQGITPHFDNLDQAVYADSKWLDFVLGQVIANAAKYARPATEQHKPQITFSAKRLEDGFESSKVILSIADNGIGVSPQDIPRVFEKGFTGENGRLYAKSTGIGLYLCKKLCTRMKLNISLSSIPQEGTTVTIEFPLNKMYFLE
jgi:signal transduction histidine kinase